MSAAAHLERVRSLRCVVCTFMGMTQASPTEAHHVESVRDGLSDFATTALCHDHHQGPNGVHGLHRRAFEARYKLSDIDLVAMTIRLMDKEGAFS